MTTLMFVNGLDNLKFCYIAPDDSRYGQFMCVYSMGGMIQEFKQHIKGGFKSAADAIAWFFERFPNGDVFSKENYLELQTKLLMLKMPNPQASTFDPLYMVTRPMPVKAKRSEDGKIMSDFE